MIRYILLLSVLFLVSCESEEPEPVPEPEIQTKVVEIPTELSALFDGAITPGDEFGSRDIRRYTVLIGNLIDEAGGWHRSFEHHRQNAPQKTKEHRFSYGFRCNWAQLLDFLYQLENAQGIFRITKLRVQPDPEAPSDQPYLTEVDINVYEVVRQTIPHKPDTLYRQGGKMYTPEEVYKLTALYTRSVPLSEILNELSFGVPGEYLVQEVRYAEKPGYFRLYGLAETVSNAQMERITDRTLTRLASQNSFQRWFEGGEIDLENNPDLALRGLFLSSIEFDVPKERQVGDLVSDFRRRRSRLSGMRDPLGDEQGLRGKIEVMTRE